MHRKNQKLAELGIEQITITELEALKQQLMWGGHGDLGRLKGSNFFARFRQACEGSLYLFAKYVLGMKDMTDELHKLTCDWLQNMEISRRKLLMLPVVHLKTSICSHAFPIWALIQPQQHNLLFKNMAGADTRILLHGETVAKAKENLAVISQHFKSNRLLRHLWSPICWGNPNKEAPTWTDEGITVRRDKILAEPSITAIGIGTGLEQRHYDIIIADDLACMEAALSETVMERAKMRRKALRSRLNDLHWSIELGVGTHWTANDIYVEWRKDPSVVAMVRAAIEHEQPIWPQRYKLEDLIALQAEEGIGKVLFSANYMNNPLNAAFSALDWEEVRSYRIEGNYAIFEQRPEDLALSDRSFGTQHFANVDWRRRFNFERGRPLSALYPSKATDPDETAEQRELRLMARLERKLANAQEGSGDWVRLNELFARQRQAAKERQA